MKTAKVLSFVLALAMLAATGCSGSDSSSSKKSDESSSVSSKADSSDTQTDSSAEPTADENSDESSEEEFEGRTITFAELEEISKKVLEKTPGGLEEMLGELVLSGISLDVDNQSPYNYDEVKLLTIPVNEEIMVSELGVPLKCARLQYIDSFARVEGKENSVSFDFIMPADYDKNIDAYDAIYKFLFSSGLENQTIITLDELQGKLKEFKAAGEDSGNKVEGLGFNITFKNDDFKTVGFTASGNEITVYFHAY